MKYETPATFLRVKKIGSSWYLIYRNYEKVHLLNNTGLDMFLAIMNGIPMRRQCSILLIYIKYKHGGVCK